MIKKKFHIRKNDKVIIIAGKEKGKIGTVLNILPKKGRATVEKLNLMKRHTKAGPQSPTGGIIEKESSIHISNLMLICGKCAESTRVEKKILEDGKKVRACKKCGEILD